jgi:hypothetical protein
MRTLATARLKRARAVELVAQGLSYDQVARTVGYSHRGSAHKAVFTALQEREVEAVDQLRAVELARLDRLQAALWQDAMAGDVKAVSAVLRIIDLRLRLLGLGRGVTTPTAGAAPSALVIGPAEDNPGDATDER